ncbi:MAG TPA: Wzz/FepE/Etk N-terminal domain-containing protein [Candidatus Limnocylindria bacterium]|nr:Wzz/FepE/Etk N-terminal domain-containing protein [Candidatus Limnocylindria bacterium]
MDFTPGTRILRQNWRVITMTAVLAAVLAYGVSFLFAPTYGATSRVLVRARETRLLTATGQDLKSQPGVVDSTLTKSLTQTNSGLIKGRAVAEHVVRDLGLDRQRPVDDSLLGMIRSAMRSVRNWTVAMVKYGFYREPTSAFEAAVGEVTENLTATPVKDSYLIEIKATADRPELAADMADAAARALVKVSQERFRQDSAAYTEFLKGQAAEAQEAVNKAQGEIRAYKEQQGIVDVTEELKLGAGTQETIREMLRTTQVDLESARAELAAIDASLRRVNSTETSTSTVSTGRSSTTTTSTSPNRVYQDLVSKRATVESKIASLEARQAALTIDLGNRSTLLPQQEARLRELERQLTAATDTYRAVRSSYDAASLNAAQGAEEVSVVDHASAPLYPEKPLRYLFALVGLVCGAAAGTGLVQLLSRRRGGRTLDVSAGRRWLGRRSPLPATAATATTATEIAPAHSAASRQ